MWNPEPLSMAPCPLQINLATDSPSSLSNICTLASNNELIKTVGQTLIYLFILLRLYYCYRGCCADCKPYYVIILSLVCGGAALLSLISLASMIRLNIGILPKGRVTFVCFVSFFNDHSIFNKILSFYTRIRTNC